MVYIILFSAVSIIFRLLLSYRVYGRENLTEYKKNGRPFVICANHLSMIDPILIAMAWGIGRKLSIMGKAELFKNPFLSWVFTNVGVFPVDRGKGDTSVIDKAMDDVKNGQGMLIFPEGTRGSGVGMGRFKSGAFLVAAGTEADIIPVRVVYPTKSGRLRFLYPAAICIGKAISSGDLGLSDGSKHALRRAKTLVRQRLDELYADYCDKVGYIPPQLPRTRDNTEVK